MSKKSFHITISYSLTWNMHTYFYDQKPLGWLRNEYTVYFLVQLHWTIYIFTIFYFLSLLTLYKCHYDF
jgi:hypothetical protein